MVRHNVWVGGCTGQSALPMLRSLQSSIALACQRRLPALQVQGLPTASGWDPGPAGSASKLLLASYPSQQLAACRVCFQRPMRRAARRQRDLPFQSPAAALTARRDSAEARTTTADLRECIADTMSAWGHV